MSTGPRLKGLGKAREMQGGDDSMSSPTPRSNAIETLIQNYLWDTVLSYQDGVRGAEFGDGDKAARLGHFGLIRSLSKPRMDEDSRDVGGDGYEEPLLFTPAAVDGAAAEGHLELVRWLHLNRPEGGTSQGLIDAAAGGHVHVVKWLMANREDNDVWRALDAAAGAPANSSSQSEETGLLEVLLEALPTGLSDLSIRDRVALAAGAGRVDVLEWLRLTHNNGISDSRSMEDLPGGKGSRGSQPFASLEYSQSAVAAAAEKGYIHVLQWLRDYGLSVSDRKRNSSRHRFQVHKKSSSSSSGGGGGNKKINLRSMFRFNRRNSSHRDSSRGHGCSPPESATSLGNPGNCGASSGGDEAVSTIDSDLNGGAVGREGSRGNGVETPGRRWRPGDKTGSLKVSAVVEDAAAAGGHLEVLRWIAEHTATAFPERKKSFLMRRGHQAAASAVITIAPSSNEGVSSGAQGLGGRCTALAFEKACEAGLLSTAIWLAAERFNEVQSAENCLEKAAKNGHLEMVKWLSGSSSWSPAGFRWAQASTAAMDVAAAGGHLQMVQWLHEHRSEGCTTRAMNEAAAGGHLETVIWLHQHRTEGCTTRAMDLAAAGGHLNIVKWLHENRTEGCTTAAMAGAAENNHLETLEWLRFNRPEGWTTRATAAAARRGHLTALAYLLLGGKSERIERYADGFGGFNVGGEQKNAFCNIIASTSSAASPFYNAAGEGGNQGTGGVPANVSGNPASTDGLELASGEGLAPAFRVTLNLDEAAREGRLRVLEWARWATAEEGHRGPREYWDGVFPTNVFLDRFCRRRGGGCCCCLSFRSERCGDGGLSPQEEEEDQEVIDEPLRGERACPNEGSCYCCSYNGGRRMLEKDILNSATELDIDYAGWRRFSQPGDGYSISPEPKQGVGRGRRAMRGVAIGKTRFNVVVSSAAVDEAAANGHLKVVRWLYYHRSEGGTSRAVESAAANGHVRVVDWLYRNTRLRATLKGSILKPSALDIAAANGHLEVIRWFHRHTGKEDNHPECFDGFNGFTYRVMDEAAANGHLQVCWWLYRHRREGCSWNAFDGAAAGGHTHVLDWLAQKFGRVGPSAVAFPKAANSGHLHVMEWLQRHYPREADAGCVWAFLELSENSPFESVRTRRHDAADAEMLELLRRRVALTSRSGIRGWIPGTGAGVACVPGKGIFCSIA